MSHYFYLAHPYLPGEVTLQVPLVISAEDEETAREAGEAITRRLGRIFKFVMSPSDPVPYDVATNQGLADNFFAMLEDGMRQGESISIELPADFSHPVHQFNLDSTVHNLKALVVLGGNTESRYSL